MGERSFVPIADNKTDKTTVTKNLKLQLKHELSHLESLFGSSSINKKKLSYNITSIYICPKLPRDTFTLGLQASMVNK